MPLNYTKIKSFSIMKQAFLRFFFNEIYVVFETNLAQLTFFLRVSLRNLRILKYV